MIEDTNIHSLRLKVGETVIVFLTFYMHCTLPAIQHSAIKCNRRKALPIPAHLHIHAMSAQNRVNITFHNYDQSMTMVKTCTQATDSSIIIYRLHE